MAGGKSIKGGQYKEVFGLAKIPFVPPLKKGERRSKRRELKQRSRQLRDNMTEAERRLWERIRMRQLKGYHFYRQKPVGDYIVDFFCHRAKLVIEIDSSHHLVGETIEYDQIRDDYLSSLGLKVLRFANEEVLNNTEGVVERIEEEVG